MNTIRVYETSTISVVIAIALVILGGFLSLFADGIFNLSPTEYTGIAIAEVMAICLAAYVTHAWAFGSKIRIADSLS